MCTSQDIDEVVKQLYSSKKYRELKALKILFSNQFLSKLKLLLNKNCRNESSFRESYDIHLGWIDKIPLAEFISQTEDYNGNVISNKVEIGDCLLVFTHNQFENGSHVPDKEFCKRAIILQAKVSSKQEPETPITKLNKNKVTSTSKELALLHSWPLFNLFKTSRSQLPILKNVNISRANSSSKFMGYYDKGWYCGEPDFGALCNQTIGSLLIDLIKGKEGADYLTTENKEWSSLIKIIIELCSNSKLPKYLFTKQQKRIQSTGTLYSNPLHLIFNLLLTKKRFPILFISRNFEEGKINN